MIRFNIFLIGVTAFVLQARSSVCSSFVGGNAGCDVFGVYLSSQTLVSAVTAAAFSVFFLAVLAGSKVLLPKE